MTDIADLRIRAQTDGIDNATKELNQLEKAGGKAEKSTDSLMGTIGKFASGLAIGAAVLAGFNKLMNTQRQFDVINAGLLTATGSAEKASLAFEALQEFATKTPYDLQQVSESFVKLVNLGLTPSERALTSYGNTASAMGKDLNQMIEAVADASTGEMERLKEFGIKASKQGDQIKFTFRGVKETVAFESGAIEDYLIKLGENNFGDSMSNRMKTLDGALSNLGDSWDQLFLGISKGGVGEMMAGVVNMGLDAIEGLSDWVNSGELQGGIASMGESFKPFVADASEAMDIVSKLMTDFTSWVSTEYPEDMQILSSAWKDFPANIRAIIQIATVHVAWFVEQVRIAAGAVSEYWAAMQDGWGGETISAAIDRTRTAMEANTATREDSINGIFKERQATMDSAKAAHAAAIQKAADAKKAADARRAANAGQDRLAQFGVDKPKPGASDAAGKKGKGDAEAKRRAKEFESLVDDLRTDEEALAISYGKRRAIIENSTAAESDIRKDLMGRLNQWRDKEAQDINDSQNRELKQIEQSMLTQEQLIEQSYEKRKAIVMASMEDGAPRARILEKLASERAEDLAAEIADRQVKRDRLMQDFLTDEELARQSRDRLIEEQRQGYAMGLIDKEEFERNKRAIEEFYEKQREAAMVSERADKLSQWGSMFGALGQLSDQFSKGQGKNAKKMFEVTKALNLAQTIMQTSAAVMKAYADPALVYPMNIVASVAAAAAGAAQVAQISSTQFSGAYDKGGHIPAGMTGMVGERGMEFVQGPADVTSRQDTARMLRKAAEGGGGGGDVVVSISVNVDNSGNASSKTSTKGDSDDAQNAKQFGQMIDLRVRDIILREQRQGGLLNANSR